MKRYIHRAIEKEIRDALSEFPVIILTGPRQTGKSTLLQKTFPHYSYVTLDDPINRKIAADDPKHFLASEKKMIIEEIQYLPELLPHIKIAVDADRRQNGRFILTGSQYFPIMKGITESLAGRAALFELLGFSTEEIPPKNHGDIKTVYKTIFKGFFPELIASRVDQNRFYSSYIQTYLERDIRQIASVHDLRVFQDFLELLAARAGSLLNLNEISKECGISFTSARRWLSLLETTRIVYLLQPYTRNISKRVVKSPKIFFTDTGLLSFLLRYPDAASLQTGPQSGALFENLILAELLKYKFNHNLNFGIYFYRDSNHNEVDFVLDFGTSLKLVEVKKTTTPKPEHFKTLEKITREIKGSKGYMLCNAIKELNISKSISLLPWHKFNSILKA